MTNWLSPNPFSSNPTTTCTAIANIGDVNPIEYGGGFVFKCKEAGRPAYYSIEYTHGEESSEGLQLVVYREDIPDGDIWEYYDWASITSLSQSTGLSVRELRSWGEANAPPVSKAAAIETIASYYGWHELDQYPLTFSPSELRRRWRAALKKKL